MNRIIFGTLLVSLGALGCGSDPVVTPADSGSDARTDTRDAGPRFECSDFGDATSFTAGCQAATVACIEAATTNAQINTCLMAEGTNRNACVGCLNDSLSACIIDGVPTAARRTSVGCAFGCANADLETEDCGSNQTCIRGVVEACIEETDANPDDWDALVTCFQSDNTQCIVRTDGGTDAGSDAATTDASDNG